MLKTKSWREVRGSLHKAAKSAQDKKTAKDTEQLEAAGLARGRGGRGLGRGLGAAAAAFPYIPFPLCEMERGCYPSTLVSPCRHLSPPFIPGLTLAIPTQLVVFLGKEMDGASDPSPTHTRLPLLGRGGLAILAIHTPLSE